MRLIAKQLTVYVGSSVCCPNFHILSDSAQNLSISETENEIRNLHTVRICLKYQHGAEFEPE